MQFGGVGSLLSSGGRIEFRLSIRLDVSCLFLLNHLSGLNLSLFNPSSSLSFDYFGLPVYGPLYYLAG